MHGIDLFMPLKAVSVEPGIDMITAVKYTLLCFYFRELVKHMSFMQNVDVPNRAKTRNQKMRINTTQYRTTLLYFQNESNLCMSLVLFKL